MSKRVKGSQKDSRLTGDGSRRSARLGQSSTKSAGSTGPMDTTMGGDDTAQSPLTGSQPMADAVDMEHSLKPNQSGDQSAPVPVDHDMGVTVQEGDSMSDAGEIGDMFCHREGTWYSKAAWAKMMPAELVFTDKKDIERWHGERLYTAIPFSDPSILTGLGGAVVVVGEQTVSLSASDTVKLRCAGQFFAGLPDVGYYLHFFETLHAYVRVREGFSRNLVQPAISTELSLIHEAKVDRLICILSELLLFGHVVTLKTVPDGMSKEECFEQLDKLKAVSPDGYGCFKGFSHWLASGRDRFGPLPYIITDDPLLERYINAVAKGKGAGENLLPEFDIRGVEGAEVSFHQKAIPPKPQSSPRPKPPINLPAAGNPDPPASFYIDPVNTSLFGVDSGAAGIETMSLTNATGPLKEPGIPRDTNLVPEQGLHFSPEEADKILKCTEKAVADYGRVTTLLESLISRVNSIEQTIASLATQQSPVTLNVRSSYNPTLFPSSAGGITTAGQATTSTAPKASTVQMIKIGPVGRDPAASAELSYLSTMLVKKDSLTPEEVTCVISAAKSYFIRANRPQLAEMVSSALLRTAAGRRRLYSAAEENPPVVHKPPPPPAT